MSQTTQEPVTTEQGESQPATKPKAPTETKARTARRAPRARTETRSRRAHPAGAARTHRRARNERPAADEDRDRRAQTDGAVERRFSDQYHSAFWRALSISGITSSMTFLTTWQSTSNGKTLFITTATAFLAPFGARFGFEGKLDTARATSR